MPFVNRKGFKVMPQNTALATVPENQDYEEIRIILAALTRASAKVNQIDEAVKFTKKMAKPKILSQ
jgi:hypothetical protein